MRTAFKEWAIVVDALLSGDQILILRKGGIHEGKGGFQVQFPRFLLFPTLFHQQRDCVIPKARQRYDLIAPGLPGPETVRLEGWAEVVQWRRLNCIDDAGALRGEHIWSDRVIAERFDWGGEKNIVAMAVRVFRLSARIELPMRPGYRGCKSWIDLAEEICLDGSSPVLDQKAFEARCEAFRKAGFNPREA